METTIFAALDNSDFRNTASKIASDKSIKSDHVKIGFKIETANVINDSAWHGLAFELKRLGFPIFLDLKLANGPAVIRKVIKEAANWKVDILTVSFTLGSKVLKDMQAYSKSVSGPQLAVLGPLTFLDDQDAMELYGCDYASAVRRAAEVTRRSGTNCMIVPPTQLENLKDYTFRKISPGIRRMSDKKAGQVQISDPIVAIVQGATDLVIGSPIYNSDDPVTELCSFIVSVEKARRIRNYNELTVITQILVRNRAVSIRDLSKGEKPFVYSSGNRGPGYIDVKSLIGAENGVYQELCQILAHKVARYHKQNPLDFIEGNVTGGIIPGWEVAQHLQLPFIYMRKSVKVEGNKELFTGITPDIQTGMHTIVIEELVNYAKTTVEAVTTLREAGYIVNSAATILTYDHDEQRERLKKAGLELISLIDLRTLITLIKSENMFSINSIKSYRSYLENPIRWQLDRNFAVPKATALKAMELGYKMDAITDEEAILDGIPESKVKEMGPYYKNITSKI